MTDKQQKRIDRLVLANDEKDQEIRRLRRLQKSSDERADLAESRLEIVQSISEANPRIPTWRAPSAKKSKKHRGTPTLLLSDLHFGETVNPAEIEWSNAYDIDLAEARLKHTFESAVNLCRTYISGVEYDGFVCALGGDILGGGIHPELMKTNGQTDFEAVVHWVPKLAAGISLLADEFGKVFVPCVTGNHDRSPANRRSPSKQRAQDSFSWIIYHWLQHHFSGDDRVQVQVSEGADLRYSVYDTTYNLTHGDQFKGGNGIGGIAVPIMRGAYKKAQRQAALGNPYDYLVLGHWHQLMFLPGVIINGSMKGYDEYAYTSNFGFERPQQALWLTTPERGVSMQMPVHCDLNNESWKQ